MIINNTFWKQLGLNLQLRPVKTVLLNEWRLVYTATQRCIACIEKTFISRWNVEAAQEKHWDLYDFQGTDNVWIIGGGAIFENLNLIMEYNQMLVSNMI
jgi:hypothetical protein